MDPATSQSAASGFIVDLKNWVLVSEEFRQVLYETKGFQLITMKLDANQVLEPEKHDVFQFFYILEGKGAIYFGGDVYPFSAGSCMTVNPHTVHSIFAATNVKLFTIYGGKVH